MEHFSCWAFIIHIRTNDTIQMCRNSFVLGLVWFYGLKLQKSWFLIIKLLWHKLFLKCWRRLCFSLKWGQLDYSHGDNCLGHHWLISDLWTFMTLTFLFYLAHWSTVHQSDIESLGPPGRDHLPSCVWSEAAGWRAKVRGHKAYQVKDYRLILFMRFYSFRAV